MSWPRDSLRFIPLLVLACALPAVGQVNSQQIRQRYEKNTKGASIDDYIKKLGSDDADKRLEAVKSLGATKDNKAIEYLIQAVGDPDIRVQCKAIDMLGEMRATEATPVLVQRLFLVTTDSHMKNRLLASLGKIGDARAARPIIEFLQRDLDPATRGTAIYALGDIGAAESVDALSQISQDDQDATLRRLAGEALGKVQVHQAVQQKELKGVPETFLDTKEQQPPPE